MSSSQNSKIKSKSKTRKSQHEETYNLVLDCLKTVNEEARSQFVNQYRGGKIWLNKLQYWLLLHPNFLFVVPIVSPFILYVILLVTYKITKDNTISLAFLLIYFLIYIIMSFLLLFKFPKLEIEWDDKWGKIKNL